MPGVSPAILEKVNAYMIAAENATAEYLQAGLGFNPANEQPVTPIV